jgi:hypothetical protein
MAKLDVNKIAERLAQLNEKKGTGSSMDFLEIKDGRNVVRVLPASNDDDMFYEEAWVHYGVGATEENKKGTMLVCPTTAGDHMKCPVCETVKELRALSRKKEDKYDKQARGLNRKKRVYYNSMDRGDDLTQYKKDEEGKWTDSEGEDKSPVKVMGTGVGIFKDILGLICDPEYGDITDPEEGLDLIINKTGQGMNTEYKTTTVRKESAIGFDEWKECLHDLKSLTKFKSYDEIAAILSGEPIDDEGEKSKDTEKDDKKDTKKDKEDKSSDANTEGDAEGDELQKQIQEALLRRKANKA